MLIYRPHREDIMSNIEDIKDLDKNVFVDFVNSIGTHIISKEDQVELFEEDDSRHMLLVISSPKETREESLISSVFIFEDTKCFWKKETFGNDIDLSTTWVQYRANKKLLCRLIAEHWNDQKRREIRALQKQMISKDTIDELRYHTAINEIE